ncbi:hypothetical protein [Streptomyces sp. NA02536]|uniref:hypothetical protein n=1 Tax=Streptomyces sp. NA02536 TaxID=2742133 RepID=UPI001590CCD1|nr:hypothetical protein [Streptomyces sp. NA02536]QKW00399.1 hypothetical protein HUT14_11220 [Streptomyces sp. NA02536]
MTATAFEYGPNPAFAGNPRAVDDLGGDYLLAPPDPAARLNAGIDPRDRRRLDLHAALTAAGIPPRPEDREAIESLSALSCSINSTIQRWLHHTL